MKVFFSFIILFSIATIQNVSGICNECGEISGVACISETAFNYCFSGVPNTDYNDTCASNTVCSDTAEVCAKSGLALCTSSCGVCSSNLRFACMSKTTFSLCMGGNEPVGPVRDCPTGKVCSISATAGQFCITPTATDEASCRDNEVIPAPTTEPPSTETSTPSPTIPTIPTIPTEPTNPSEICRQKNQHGRFPVETSCREYIYCYYMGGMIQGQKYSCPGNSIFDATLRNCVASTSNCV